MTSRAKADLVKAGSVYDTDGRKGKLTLRLLEDVDYSKDTFFEAEIVDGFARFASGDNRVRQRVEGLGAPGTGLSFRTTLTHLVKRRKNLER